MQGKGGENAGFSLLFSPPRVPADKNRYTNARLCAILEENQPARGRKTPSSAGSTGISLTGQSFPGQSNKGQVQSETRSGTHPSLPAKRGRTGGAGGASFGAAGGRALLLCAQLPLPPLRDRPCIHFVLKGESRIYGRKTENHSPWRSR